MIICKIHTIPHHHLLPPNRNSAIALPNLAQMCLLLPRRTRCFVPPFALLMTTSQARVLFESSDAQLPSHRTNLRGGPTAPLHAAHSTAPVASSSRERKEAQSSECVVATTSTSTLNLATRTSQVKIQQLSSQTKLDSTTITFTPPFFCGC